MIIVSRRIQELEADMKRGRLPEQNTAPRHDWCHCCKGAGMLGVTKTTKGKRCNVCAGRGIIFDPS